MAGRTPAPSAARVRSGADVPHGDRSGGGPARAGGGSRLHRPQPELEPGSGARSSRRRSGPTDAVLASTGQPLRARHSPQPLWQRAATARRVWARPGPAGTPNAARNVFFLSLHYDEYHAAGVSGSVVCVDRRVRRVPALARALAREMAAGQLRAGDCDFRGVRGVSGHEAGGAEPGL